MDGAHEQQSTTPGSPTVLDAPVDDASRALRFGPLCVLADRLPYRPAPEEELSF